MKRVFGIETEYGITVNGVESVDVVTESIELVRCYTDHGALMKWDYELEDPHMDARGFRAQSLMQDTDESAAAHTRSRFALRPCPERRRPAAACTQEWNIQDARDRCKSEPRC
jgi:proteasome accessory factor A